MLRPILLLISALSLASCNLIPTGISNQLSPEQCAIRLQQSQTIEDAFKVLSAGGLAPDAVRVILQAIADGRTTLQIACQVANDPATVSHINNTPTSPGLSPDANSVSPPPII